MKRLTREGENEAEEIYLIVSLKKSKIVPLPGFFGGVLFKEFILSISAMLQPKRTRYRKQQKGKIRGISNRGHRVEFGSFGLKAITGGRITNRQIEAARVAMTRFMKREGKVWIRIFPDKPVTRKPQEVRMGKGKGALDHYVAVVSPGRIMFEVDGVTKKTAEEALRLAAQKLPVLTKITIRPDYSE